jgi:DNA-binding transcriptional regulator YhcF (GntR family)
MVDVSVGNPQTPAAAVLAEIAVDRRAETPIGVQLSWALRCRIADGGLPAGARLPGLRELAESTGVNVNTIRAVYQRLEREGLIESQQGSGTFVSAHTEHATAIGSIAALAAGEARASGVDPRSVAAALYVTTARDHPQPAEDLERRRVLRAQIATLERTVAELETAHPNVTLPPRKRRAGRGPVLLDEQALEGVRSELLRRLGAVQMAIDEHAAETESKLRAKPARKPKPVADSPSKTRRGAAKRPASRPAPA